MYLLKLQVSPERIMADSERMLYMTSAEAMEYGLIDRVLESTKDLPSLAMASSI